MFWHSHLSFWSRILYLSHLTGHTICMIQTSNNTQIYFPYRGHQIHLFCQAGKPQVLTQRFPLNSKYSAGDEGNRKEVVRVLSWGRPSKLNLVLIRYCFNNSVYLSSWCFLQMSLSHARGRHHNITEPQIVFGSPCTHTTYVHKAFTNSLAVKEILLQMDRCKYDLVKTRTAKHWRRYKWAKSLIFLYIC